MIAPGILIVLDGWGHLPQKREHNAIRLASTPVVDRLMARYPWATLQASGEAVGLPANAVGNSEIGHLTIGAGRRIEYESTRVERAAATGEMLNHPLLRAVLARLRDSGRALHLLGLCSDGMVHSHIGHFAVLLEVARAANLSRVYLHPSTDGRDVPDGTAARYLDELEAMVERIGVGAIATVMGRLYTMDRSEKWELTEAAYAAVAQSRGHEVQNWRTAITEATLQGLPDDQVAPAVIVDPHGHPVGRLEQGDALIFVNFRGDRMRQLLRVFAAESFDCFPRGSRPLIDVLTLTEYFATPPVPTLFAQSDASDGLVDLLDLHGVRNVRIAESEKFPHVTFFVNGRDERKRQFEERLHIPSPKGVDYRHVPELSAAKVTEAIVGALRREDVGLVIANLANADVLGHTGDINAVMGGVQTIDMCLGRICDAAQQVGRWVALVGDHGNAEVMWDPQTGKPHVGHTTNPVPFVLAHPTFAGRLRPEGTLADVAPTVIELLGLGATRSMGGTSLVERVISASSSGATHEQ
jgi:2,3-bisphosphoglycerate-independent phosphoglycerate mutase